jgi:hypothetical protein
MRNEIRFTPILAGALICLALQVLLFVIGSTIGLYSFDLERGQMPSLGLGIVGGIFALISFVATFFIGGFIASRLSSGPTRFESLVQGLSVWALASLLVVSAIGTGLLSTSGVLMGQTAWNMKAAAYVSLMEKELSKARIVTDAHLLKGQAVTRIITDQDMANSADKVAQELKKKGEQVSKGPSGKKAEKQAAGTVRKAAVGTGIGALLILLASLIGGAWGGLVGRRKDVLRSYSR